MRNPLYAILTAGFLLAPGLAKPEVLLVGGDNRTTTHRFTDHRGAPAGRAETRGGRTQFFSDRGVPDGRAEVRGGQTRYYDGRGSYVGKSTTR